MYEDGYLGRENQIAKPTRVKEKFYLNEYIVPRWGTLRLNQIQPKAVEDWLHTTFDSWWTMHGVRAIMSRIFYYAEGHGLWEEGKRSPASKAKLGKKHHKYERRILSFDETARVLARLEEPYLLIIETCIATGARISEVLGLKWKHVNLDAAHDQDRAACLAPGHRPPEERGQPSRSGHRRSGGTVPGEGGEGWRNAGRMGVPPKARAGKASLGLGCARRSPSGRRGRGLRLPWTRTALVPEGQHYLAATGRRKRHRGFQDRRPQRSGNDGRVHVRSTRTAERADSAHPSEAI